MSEQTPDFLTAHWLRSTADRTLLFCSAAHSPQFAAGAAVTFATAVGTGAVAVCPGAVDELIADLFATAVALYMEPQPNPDLPLRQHLDDVMTQASAVQLLPAEDRHAFRLIMMLIAADSADLVADIEMFPELRDPARVVRLLLLACRQLLALLAGSAPVMPETARSLLATARSRPPVLTDL